MKGEAKRSGDRRGSEQQQGPKEYIWGKGELRQNQTRYTSYGQEKRVWREGSGVGGEASGPGKDGKRKGRKERETGTTERHLSSQG